MPGRQVSLKLTPQMKNDLEALKAPQTAAIRQAQQRFAAALEADTVDKDTLQAWLDQYVFQSFGRQWHPEDRTSLYVQEGDVQTVARISAALNRLYENEAAYRTLLQTHRGPNRSLLIALALRHAVAQLEPEHA